MSLERAEKIAKAVLYEGYILYPYRPSSTKNRQRWNFGTLYPEHHELVRQGLESCRLQVQVLLEAAEEATLTARLLFLQLQQRRVFERVGQTGEFRPVDFVEVDGRIYESWEQGVERNIELRVGLQQLTREPFVHNFRFETSTSNEDIRDSKGEIVGQVRRTLREIEGAVEVAAERLGTELFRIAANIVNRTSIGDEDGKRAAVLLKSLSSAHVLFEVKHGEFVSMQAPPEHLCETTSSCRNVGVYPVLVGEPGERDVMLASPIILSDYPQIASESAGDFFDATEMDEMLTLRVMTLSDPEKREVSAADDRARELLQRTEALARQQLVRTHGAIRDLRPVKDEP